MEPAHSIARLGFRKWHERRLYEAFGWLFTTLICALVAGLALELLADRKALAAWLATLALVYFAGLSAWHALRRFLQILNEAERWSRQSTCSSCRNYGVFDVLAESPRLRVRCRRCAHQWTFD